MDRSELLVDLSLYLVTSSENLPNGRSVESTVEEAIRGGVTIVQLREKDLSTDLFLKRARSLRKICRSPIKLIINDRIDIALACGADGVHLGQEDMPIEDARRLLGTKAIIGISVNTIAEARRAVEQGATYLGIGTCWPTGTKAIPEHKIIGPRGVKSIRDELIGLRTPIPLVVIGGINSNNLIRTLYGCTSNDLYTDCGAERPIGVAVVSAIMNSENPYEEALGLKSLIDAFSHWLLFTQSLNASHSLNHQANQSRLHHAANSSMTAHSTPLIHHITNTVVQNDCANLALAYGCSPIMSSNLNEMEELVVLKPGCLVMNLGTFDENQICAMKLAGRQANLIGKPIIFDPVGIGASQERKRKANELLNHVQMSVIKGNQAEIASLAKIKSIGIHSCGVDAQGSVERPAELVKQLARQELCVVVMTGESDWISDGRSVFQLQNGIKELSCITGSGCMTGTSIGCFASSLEQNVQNTSKSGLLSCLSGIHNPDGALLTASILGISVINILAEQIRSSEGKDDQFGPSKLKMKLIDRIHQAKELQDWSFLVSMIKLRSFDGD